MSDLPNLRYEGRVGWAKSCSKLRTGSTRMEEKRGQA